MKCPTCALTSDYVFCEIIITGGGTELTMTVNYGDNGPNDIFTALSK